MFSVSSYTVLQSVLAPPFVVTFHEQFQWRLYQYSWRLSGSLLL